MEAGKRKNQVTDPAWIIRWTNPYGLECKSGSREEVEEYASQKAERINNTYIIL